MSEKIYKSSGLKYVVYHEDQYYKIINVDVILNADTETIETLFESHYYQIMYYAYLEKLIKDELMSEIDIETAKTKLASIPYYDMLYTQEFLEMTLIERMTEEKFNTLKKDMEEKFIAIVSQYFGFEQ